ncbi:Protein CLEC-78 [Aphelenchoides avenae]|nr:Protein CLEC-78 [Aphelenchus avenae]
MWSLVKHCDFSQSIRGGKCVYPSKLGFRFTSTAGELSDNDKRAMTAVIHEAFDYGQDKEIDFEETNSSEELLSSIDVGPGTNISIFRKAYYCGPHRLAVPEVKVESYNTSHTCANRTHTDTYRLFAGSESTFHGEGTVTSANYPNKYDDNLRKVYILNAQTPNGRIKLHINTFVTETDYDKLLILDGSFGTPLAYLSGEKGRVSTEFRSTGPIMVLLFSTDRSESRRGWSARFSTEYD